MSIEYAPRIDNIDKNYLMNGSMDLFQRFISPSPFTGVSLTTSYSFLTADRWAMQYAGTWGGGSPASCSSTNVPNQFSKYSLNFIGSPSVITDEIAIRQRLESLIVSEASGQVVSFGLYINSNSASQVTLELWTPQGPDNYTTSTMAYTITKAFLPNASWQRVCFNGITLPSTVNGLEVRIRIANRSVLLAENFDYITQIGMTRTPTFDAFNRFGGNIQTEIQACQRYYEKSYDLEINPGTVTSNSAVSFFITTDSGNWLIPIFFAVQKRTPSPSVTSWSPASGSSGVAQVVPQGDLSSGVDTNGSRMTSFQISGISTGVTREAHLHYTADGEI